MLDRSNHIITTTILLPPSKSAPPTSFRASPTTISPGPISVSTYARCPSDSEPTAPTTGQAFECKNDTNLQGDSNVWSNGFSKSSLSECIDLCSPILSGCNAAVFDTTELVPGKNCWLVDTGGHHDEFEDEGKLTLFTKEK